MSVRAEMEAIRHILHGFCGTAVVEDTLGPSHFSGAVNQPPYGEVGGGMAILHKQFLIQNCCVTLCHPAEGRGKLCYLYFARFVQGFVWHFQRGQGSGFQKM